ncbi:hypothetical protein [Deinococcus soli (ex Cha et al. 2016)]|uniref:Uncharacterized protein n=2 Tax=Deinococcus soli (ex Cha et al. 2016) TaxID=1309411 RepID=A0AAE3XEH1_9DEIO|nr:hypothetical protein [Deinococcus soli (ex Cha et al. 2016)]MDR6218233.1 hypothetical protein [Deinococcus soli (ex Cha et al. 2016)]MDR6328973.1 hypothetical protein [Deinococcus soli (ex Cha et al. 2016)]MDR6751246.1 hypothetical protein [Deinococcus soli (ex Cha et al. 2016)]
MTDARTLWPRAQRIQWACALMELLNERSLERLPLVMSGTHAVEHSAQALGADPAIHRTRQLIGKVLTRRAVQVAVRTLNNAHADQLKPGSAVHTRFDLSYRIDPRTLHFSRLDGEEATISAAQAHLMAGPVRREHRLTPAPGGDLTARLNPSTYPVDVPIRLPTVPGDPLPQHDLTRRPDATLRISLRDLKDTARTLDAADERAQGAWLPESWLYRLTEIIALYRRDPQGLIPLDDDDDLDLTGLRHLIGLPGAGKTTLISLICAHLAAQNKRVCVFFPSIETAREYLDRLRRYGTSAAMLVGSSPNTQRKHGERLAELIASQGDGGFGHTHPGADLFAQTCPLPAYAVDERRAWDAWAPSEAPCEQIRSGDTRHLCPLWSRCGRVKNQRDLVSANIWLGHIRSADTAVPAHTSRERLQYFELIAETFDLIIVDEVDHTQSTLDELGALSLKFNGNDESVHAKAQQVTRLAMTGRLSVHDRKLLYNYQYAANTFERHLVRFHEEITTYEDQHQAELGLQLQNRLLTTNYLINQAVQHLDLHLEPHHLGAIYALWDGAVYGAYFQERRPWAQNTQIADGLGISESDAQARWDALHGALSQYLHHLTRSTDLTDELGVIERLFADLIDPTQREVLAPIARLTVTVGFTIAAYQELVRAARPLSHYDILPEAVRAQVSAALEHTVPRNLLGTFSSVRYQMADDRSGVDISYLILDTAPRLLLRRLHDRGAHVLLTSATSWMPDSSAFHVNVPPDYVLKPRKNDDIQLRLRFQPIKHPTRNEYLRFSGNRHQYEHLRLMVQHLARSGIGGLSPLEKAARNMRTAGGRDRMCALVVNSYDQVHEVVRQIAQTNEALAARTRGVVRTIPEGTRHAEQFILRGQVETLGHDDDVTVVVFPLTALGRGVNIVFNTDDGDNGVAAIGNVYFLIRPHPVVGDLSLMISNIARATERFDQMNFPDRTLSDVQDMYLQQRGKLYGDTMKLLSRTMSASRLPDTFIPAFSANLLIPILQTIGRAIRRSQPAEVFFVDAAWAPRSTTGDGADDERSSVLVKMQNLLSAYVTDPDPAEQAVMRALYQPFADAFADIQGLNPGGFSAPDDDPSLFPPVHLDDDGDLYL